MERITARQLQEMMEREDAPVVINVLSPEDYRERHIPGTENVPVSATDFVDRVRSRVVARDEPVVVYCASEDCTASEKAGEKLEKAGFTNVIDFSAGVQGWEEAGLEFVRG